MWSVCQGQMGKNSDMWDWSPDASHHNKVVQVQIMMKMKIQVTVYEDSTDENGNTISIAVKKEKEIEVPAQGTGSIVHVFKDKPVGDGFEGLAITAYHVVKEAVEGSMKIQYPDGVRIDGVRIAAYSKVFDCVMLRVWVPKGMEPFKVARMTPIRNSELEAMGYGGVSITSDNLRHWKTKVAVPTDGYVMFSDSPAIPGDSGGPCLNDKGELVGVINGGWFWARNMSFLNGQSKYTWPTKYTGMIPIVAIYNASIELKDQLGTQKCVDEDLQ